jgi:hypothetical protein
MAKFKKAILKAKTHHAPNGQVVVTPERLKHWADTHALMHSRNWHSSVHFDHQDDPAQQQLVQMGPKGKVKRGAANAVGRCVDFKLAPDGLSAEVTLDLPDSKATEKARQNVVEISPVIKGSVKDGDGQEYRDAIVSYDLVTQPVDNTQTAFVEVNDAIACSLRMVDDEGKSTVYRMGLDDRKPFGDPDDDGDELPDGNDDPTETVDDKNEDMPKVQGDDKCAEAIRAHLEQLGLGVPSDWSMTSEGADKILLGCLKTLVNAQQKADADKASDKGEDGNDQGDDDMGKLADPGFAALSLKANNALAYAEREHRRGITARLEQLAKDGRCTVDECNKHLEAIGTISLSLDDNGQPASSDVEKWIESRAAVPAGTFWDEATRTANVQRMSLVEPDARQTLGAEDAGVEYGRKLMGLDKAAK